MSPSKASGASATLLIGNVLRVKPDATVDEARRIAPMLRDLADADLAERMAQTRRRLGITPPELRRQS